MKKVNDCPSTIFQLPLILLLSMVLIISCSAAANSVGGVNIKPKPSIQKMIPTQIIIKFKNNVLDPSRDEFVQEISYTAKVNLYYLRPMSGGAHVFRVNDNINAAQIRDIIERLSKRSDVLYVEPDGIMMHQ
jgi:hypothetical protein